MSDVKFGKGQEAEALKAAIQEVKEAQKVVHLATLSEKLTKISELLVSVQV